MARKKKVFVFVNAQLKETTVQNKPRSKVKDTTLVSKACQNTTDIINLKQTHKLIASKCG